ncbi:ricin-type beta-trefoil lectin domain protein [Saccharothrix sp. HUAS TT1]|uniref:ricin-type beta-trefoil lectin domain protein n=1 Tax=unclassified Saccharothrix TaxID=2593673 RepID=UPI00345BC42A
MAVREVLVALVVACSAVAWAPPAGARATTAVIESANGSEDVWLQTLWDTKPVIAADYTGGNRQLWELGAGDNLIVNVGTGLCAAAIGGLLKGRECDPDDPGQLWWREGSGSSRVIVNDEFGTCVTYDGHELSPRLEECDFSRSDQRWHINEQ